MPPAADVIRLLIVDRSPGERERLRGLFSDVPDIDVVGEAGTVERALHLLGEISPTAVLVDCALPDPGSFAAVCVMMSLHPVPIIMLTKQRDACAAVLEIQALETGAVTLASWTPGTLGAGPGSDLNLVRTVRAMSEVKVVRRRGQASRVGTPPKVAAGPSATATAAASVPAVATTTAAAPRTVPLPIQPSADGRIELVAIGASTGGPPVLQTLLAGLSRPLPVPIMLVQHLSRGFQNSLVAWLADATGVPVKVAEHGMPLEPGTVYLAPDDRHMAVDGSGHAVLNECPAENGSRPSISVLFRSVAQEYGPRAVGILLSGMGRDGAKELRLMRDRGAVTIAQDEESSVVHSMPGEAIKLKGARYILAPDRIAAVIEHHVLWSARGLCLSGS